MSEDLLVARVRSVDDSTGKLYLQFYSGVFRIIEVSDTSVFQRDRIVTINTDDYRMELAPDEVWQDESWVGVVHLIKEEDTIVSSGGRSQIVPTREDKEYQVGNTVECKDEYGVVKVLSEKPLNSLDAPMDAETSSSRFRLEDGWEGEKYEDFGGHKNIVAQIKELEESLSGNGSLSAMGGRPVKGVLFVGPPGTGKTMLARIVASQTESAFFPVRGPEVISKWVGESERTLRNIFDDAAKEKDRGAIIFLDEVDSIAGRRDTLSHDFSRSVVTQLLTLMDGFEPNTNVLVIAATNRPDAIDPAIRRPGRFDLEIKFELPNEQEREEILCAASRKQDGNDCLPHRMIAKKTDLWTPAELAGIWHAAVRIAYKDGRGKVDEEDYLIGYEQAAAQRHRETSSPPSETI